MRTDLVHSQQSTVPAPVHRAAQARRGKNKKWLDSGDDIVNYLAQHALEKDGWWRSMSATISLLKHAHAMIERAESRISDLEDLAATDELTNLMNRRGFFDAFIRELDRAARGQSQGGLLILIDLDNFKTINDLYGHQAGDAALRLVSRALQVDIRTMDVAARLGGDEFVLLFANTTRETSLERAQNLVKQLNNLSLVWYGSEIPIRASIGLKEYKSGDKPESIFSAADSKLYAEKKNKGRDK